MPSVEQNHREASAEPTADFDAVIVGAGFSGLYMLHSLRNEMGLSTRVYEAGTDVGGTWYWNRYPGAKSDSDSYIYSYSFSKELQQEWEWSERYPGHNEIRSYLEHVADRFDLRRDIQFSTQVVDASFDEDAKHWTIRTNEGDTVTARFFIAAVGSLSASNTPDFPGRDTFAGDSYHTGHWPHEGVDFTGKRVGVIGTGATAIQAIPLIAQQAEHLTVFSAPPTTRSRPATAPPTPRLRRPARRNTTRSGTGSASRTSASSITSSSAAPSKTPPRSVSANYSPGGTTVASACGSPTTTTSSLSRRPTTPSPSGCARRSRSGSTTRRPPRN